MYELVFNGSQNGNQPEFLSTKEVAQILKIPTKTVTQLAREGELPGVKYGRCWRFLLSDILQHHRDNAVAMQQGKEVKENHGRFSKVQKRNLVHRLPVSGQKWEKQKIPPFDWQRDNQETSKKA